MQEALDAMEKAEAGREPLRAEKTRLDEARDAARKDQREGRERRESLSLKLESGKAGLESLRQSIARMDNQVGQLQTRYLELSQALAQGDEPVREQQKKTRCTFGPAPGDRIAPARCAAPTWKRWKPTGASRTRPARPPRLSPTRFREEQSQRQLALKETQLKSQTLSERIDELEENLETLLADLPEGAATEEYQNELEKLEEKIRKLEPVNLAAIEGSRNRSRAHGLPGSPARRPGRSTGHAGKGDRPH